MSEFKYRPDIDGLRGIAVILVLLFHTQLGFSGGFIGVDVFFVISGFLITGLLLRERRSTGDISLIRFYGRRSLRIFPLYYAFLVGYFLIVGLTGNGRGVDWRGLAIPEACRSQSSTADVTDVRIVMAWSFRLGTGSSVPRLSGPGA